MSDGSASEFSAADLKAQTKRRRRAVRASTWPKFYENLAFMVKAGLTLRHALTELQTLNEDVGLSRHLRDVIQALNQGVAVPEAFDRNLPAFPGLHKEMLKIGVETGALEEVLEQLAAYENAGYVARLQLVKNLSYPALQFGAAFTLISVAPAHFQKSFADTMNFFGRELPWSVTLFFHYSWFMNYLLIAVVLLALPLLSSGVRDRLAHFWVSPKIRDFRLRCRTKSYRISSYIPGLKKAIRAYSQERFTRALALQLHTGRRMVPAVRAAFLVTEDPAFIEAAPGVEDALTNGQPLPDALEATELFDKIQFLSFLSAGSESGATSELLLKSADLQAADLQVTLARSMALLNPLLLMLIGGLVAALVMSVFYPMIQLTQSL